ncbi:MAG: AraC family transcriptional regulator [Desulfovibrionaceae bacterium]|jgi:AraC-like DNA-binding protein|nr:AraC family transcriptional regulator [Desulfovibrionaceae bacterium]
MNTSLPAQFTELAVYGPDGTLAPAVASQPVYSSSTLAWRGFVLERHRLPPGSVPLAASPAHILCLTFNRMPPSSISWHVQGRHVRGQMAPERIYLRAAEEEFSCVWTVPLDILFLSVEPRSIAWACDMLGVKGPQTLRSHLDCQKLLADDEQSLRQIILKLNACANGENPGGSLYEETLLLACSLQLVMLYRADGRSVASPARASALPAAKLTAVREYIWENLTRPITLEDIAQSIGVSTHRLSVQFRKTFSITLWQYVLRCRAAYARRLIGRHQGMSLADVANDSGFESYTSFFHAFSKFYGVSPSNLRAGKPEYFLQNFTEARKR